MEYCGALQRAEGRGPDLRPPDKYRASTRRVFSCDPLWSAVQKRYDDEKKNSQAYFSGESEMDQSADLEQLVRFGRALAVLQARIDHAQAPQLKRDKRQLHATRCADDWLSLLKHRNNRRGAFCLVTSRLDGRPGEEASLAGIVAVSG
jgi:hypothetical protein